MTDATAALMGDNGGADGGAAGGADGGANMGTQSTGAWNEGFDEETSAYVTNKGWQSPADILSSYRNLEKFAGGSKNLVELPGVDADQSAMDSFYAKLGRPDSPEKYGLKMPDGGDPELADWFRNVAHQSGLTDKQAASLFDSWNEMSATRLQAIMEQQNADSEKAIADLKKEWGQGYDAQIDMGKRAVAALGYDQESLNALESKMGTADMLKLFAAVGSKMGEPAFEGGPRSGSAFGLTPAAAKQQIADLRMDTAFQQEYLNGNKDAVAKMQRLMEAAYAES